MQVMYAEMENSRTTFYFQLESVPVEDMKTVVPKMKKVLESQVKNFDMKRMTDVIRKNYQEELSSIENSPHNSIAYAIIGDFLYGNDQQTTVYLVTIYVLFGL